MVKNVRTTSPEGDDAGQRIAPKYVVKQEFGKRVYKLMLAKGWNQSDLHRQSGLPRDSISVYIRGKSLPNPLSLQKLADALGTTPEELLPSRVESAIFEDEPAFEMKVSPNSPDVAWLRINRPVSTATAVKIIELLHADDAADRKRGS